MIEKTVIVSMPEDSQERPVAVLVQIASQFESKVHLVSDDKRINAKSIMGMMSMDFAKGEKIKVVADGADEEQAVEKIVEYLVSEK